MANEATTSSAPNLPAPMSDAELRKQAASQVGLEIDQSVAPIQSQIGIAQADEQKALGQVSGMFDALQPVVQQGASAVQASYDQAISQENSVFSTAQSQLQQLRSNRAADAQSMAQKVGGPVAIGDWTAPFDNAATDLTYLGAGQQLHTLAYAQAGEQSAQQFAGQIFPLVRTEQMATVRTQFEDQIKDYQDQITALQSQKGAQVNKRYNDLRTQELQYSLNRAQYQLSKLDDQRNYNLEVKKAKADKTTADRTYKLDKQKFNLDKTTAAHDYKVAQENFGLDKTKAGHDYEIAKRTANTADRQVDLAFKNYKLDLAKYVEAVDEASGSTSTGKKTLAALERDDQVDQAAATLGLSNKELAEKKAEFAASSAIETKKMKTDQSTEWVDLLENAVNPQPGKTYTHSQEEEINATAALSDTSGTVYTRTDNDGKTHYYKRVSVTETTPAMEAITDPTRLVDYLYTAMNDPKNFPRSRAIELVQSRFPELKAWKYGEKWPPSKSKKKNAKGVYDPVGALNAATPDPFDLLAKSVAGIKNG
jgi:hypothetical protein